MFPAPHKLWAKNTHTYVHISVHPLPFPHSLAKLICLSLQGGGRAGEEQHRCTGDRCSTHKLCGELEKPLGVLPKNKVGCCLQATRAVHTSIYLLLMSADYTAVLALPDSPPYRHRSYEGKLWRACDASGQGYSTSMALSQALFQMKEKQKFWRKWTNNDKHFILPVGQTL